MILAKKFFAWRMPLTNCPLPGCGRGQLNKISIYINLSTPVDKLRGCRMESIGRSITSQMKHQASLPNTMSSSAHSNNNKRKDPPHPSSPSSGMVDRGVRRASQRRRGGGGSNSGGSTPRDDNSSGDESEGGEEEHGRRRRIQQQRSTGLLLTRTTMSLDDDDDEEDCNVGGPRECLSRALPGTDLDAPPAVATAAAVPDEAAAVVPEEVAAAAAAAAAAPPPPAQRDDIAIPASTGDCDGNGDGDEWACPRCTLLNPLSSVRCDACLMSIRMSAAGDGDERAPGDEADATTADLDPDDAERRAAVEEAYRRMREEMEGSVVARGVGGGEAGTVGFVSAVQAANSVISGAVIGSVFAGAAGALVGAAAGGIADGLARWGRRRRRRREAAAATAAALAVGREGGEYVGEGGGIRVTTRSLPGTGMSVVMVRSSGPVDAGDVENLIRSEGRGGGGGGIVGSIAGTPFPLRLQGMLDDPESIILHMLMAAAASQGMANPENMTYEELLRRFGLGSESRGASSDVINALPLSKLVDVETDLPAESERTCGICLEDFGVGDSVRKLPGCGHVLHKECGDRWFGAVASCPICKRDIRPDAAEAGGTCDEQEQSEG